MKNNFNKVFISERHPDKYEKYLTNIGLLMFIPLNNDFVNDDFKIVKGVEFWLEEIDLTQLQKDKEELIEMLESIQNTTPDKALFYEIESLIQKHKQ